MIAKIAIKLSAIILVVFLFDIPSAQELNELGHFGLLGQYNEIRIDRDFCYGITESGFQVLSLANPDSIHRVSDIIFPPEWFGYSWHLEVNGDYAYASRASSGPFLVIDISDSFQPEIVSYLDGLESGRLEFVSPYYVYVYCQGGIVVMDVSDPLHPQNVASMNVESATGYDVNGDWLYISTYNQHLKIYDITDRLHPSFMTEYDSPIGDEEIFGLSVQDTTAATIHWVYVDSLGYHETYLEIISVANPIEPRFLGAYELEFNPASVKINNGLAFIYLTDYIDEHPLSIYDIRDPSNISLLHWNFSRNSCLQAIGNRLYISGDRRAVGVWDTSDPSQFQFLGDYPDVGGAGYVLLNSDRLYISSNGPLLSLNVADPYNLSLSTIFDIGGGNGMCISNNYLYLLSNGLTIYDISNPDLPGLVSSTELPRIERRLFVNGDYAYVAITSQGLAFLDVSDPREPVIVNTYPAPAIFNMAIRGTTAFMLLSLDSLEIVNISDPLAPQHIGSCALGDNHAYGIYLYGNYAYFNQFDGLDIVDISNPQNPFRALTEPLPISFWDMTIYNDKAYLSCREEGLKIYSLADPVNPSLLTTYDSRGSAYSCAVSGNYIYLDDANSLTILSYNPDKVDETISPVFEMPSIANWPNPFNLSTVIEYTLPEASNVKIDIYNITGSRVATVLNGDYQLSGRHTAYWDGNGLASGVYFIQVVAEKNIITKKAVLVK